jgi:hypothetical protein
MVGMLEHDITIRGYERDEGTRHVDAAALLAQPGFWPVFLSSTAQAEQVHHVFPLEDGQRTAMERLLSDPQRWPVLSVRLAPAGRGMWYRLRIVYRNFDGDAGIDFLVTSDLGGTAIMIASIEGHFQGPGLCWEELQTLAAMPDPDLTPAQRLLMALPLLGDDATPSDALTQTAEALQATGGVGPTQDLADELLSHWGRPAWKIRQGVRMCLGRHSRRHVQDLSLNHLQAVDEAMGGRFYRNRRSQPEYRHRAAGRTAPRWRFEVTDSRLDPQSGLRLLGRLDGHIRDGESAQLMVGDSVVFVEAIQLDFVDNRQLALTVKGQPPAAAPPAGATLQPVD